MRFREIWDRLIWILPAYGAYNGQRDGGTNGFIGGLLAGLAIAVFAWAGTKLYDRLKKRS